MMRRFITLDGEIMAEEQWEPNPNHRCFWCDDHLKHSYREPCYNSFDGSHDWVTICDRELA